MKRHAEVLWAYPKHVTGMCFEISFFNKILKRIPIAPTKEDQERGGTELLKGGRRAMREGPTPLDLEIWAFRVKVGCEQSLVLEIMNKLKRTGQGIEVSTVFAQDGIIGTLIGLGSDGSSLLQL
ncbi:hypothetical protein EI94DRAFT_1701252 [Lactarius quietus]|nr:hypothetical protein EI94DRAFT_1701252 [Lactarius quietus]